MIRQQKASSCASTTTVGQDGDNDALGPCRPKCFGRLAGGAAGRENVIDEQNGLALQRDTRPSREGAANVLGTIRRDLPGLHRRVP